MEFIIAFVVAFVVTLLLINRRRSKDFRPPPVRSVSEERAGYVEAKLHKIERAQK